MSEKRGMAVHNAGFVGVRGPGCCGRTSKISVFSGTAAGCATGLGAMARPLEGEAYATVDAGFWRALYIP